MIAVVAFWAAAAAALEDSRISGTTETKPRARLTPTRSAPVGRGFDRALAGPRVEPGTRVPVRPPEAAAQRPAVPEGTGRDTPMLFEKIPIAADSAALRRENPPLPQQKPSGWLERLQQLDPKTHRA